eukprot:1022337-Prymnesium_polylepis.1
MPTPGALALVLAQWRPVRTRALQPVVPPCGGRILPLLSANVVRRAAHLDACTTGRGAAIGSRGRLAASAARWGGERPIRAPQNRLA